MEHYKLILGLQYHAPAIHSLINEIVTMRIPALCLLLPLLPVTLGACGSFAFPYRPDVQQGNTLTQDTINHLRTNMSEQEVRHLLGSPLLIDPFHANRWDYYYSVKQGNTPPEQRHVILYFKNEHLLRIEGDVRAHKGT